MIWLGLWAYWQAFQLSLRRRLAALAGWVVAHYQGILLALLGAFFARKLLLDHNSSVSDLGSAFAVEVAKRDLKALEVQRAKVIARDKPLVDAVTRADATATVLEMRIAENKAAIVQLHLGADSTKGKTDDEIDQLFRKHGL
jgi:citrate lyase gamma subunit